MILNKNGADVGPGSKVCACLTFPSAYFLSTYGTSGPGWEKPLIIVLDFFYENSRYGHQVALINLRSSSLGQVWSLGEANIICFTHGKVLGGPKSSKTRN